MNKIYMIEPSGTIHEYESVADATDAHNSNPSMHVIKCMPKSSCKYCYGRGIVGTKLISPIPYDKKHAEKFVPYLKLLLCRCCA